MNTNHSILSNTNTKTTTLALMMLVIITLIHVLCIETTSAAPIIEARGISSCYKKGNAKLTMYWIPKEGDVDMLNNGKTVKLTGSKTKSLKTISGKTIAKVASVTYDKFQMEGTGLLKSGKMVNLGANKNVFMELDRSETPYGLGDNSNGLVPWVSVASNDMKRGTKLYIKEFDGLKLPNGRTHNGCVRVDDKGWSFSGCQLDWFTLQYSAYKELVDTVGDEITVVEKDSCQLKDYVTKTVQKWAVL
ncbi:hypothetical protein BDB00DRAFT_842872 [Zychaea mexicana]|uniref:uncharacterized protein n=1 Tax=Zychaea mexicana TaxID=64656 RepID=UPI0022FEC637|nr:uncharacterized protein BDB00DRAFT_842872 [Zychaea mexicana]KAI9489536.1 hypothetical protein BDB00DRAFT_842872 [Zychaea mexicana]